MREEVWEEEEVLDLEESAPVLTAVIQYLTDVEYHAFRKNALNVALRW